MAPRTTGLAKFRDQIGSAYSDRMIAIPPQAFEVVSTGSLTLDYALRVGGWTRGRIHELMGPPDSAKTLIAILSMVQQQAAFPDLLVSFIDMEKTWSYPWAWGLGLDTSEDRWLHLRPETSEEASDMLRQCVRSGFSSIAVVDSIGGMASTKELYVGKDNEDIRDADKEMVGKNAQVITRMVKHTASLAAQTNTTVLLINQPRAVISSLALSDQSAGPKAMQHATSTKIRMTRMGGEGSKPKMIKIDGNEEPVSIRFKAHVERSKVAPPGAVAEFWVNNRPTGQYGPAGINVTDEYVTIGIRSGAIAQASSSYTIPGLGKAVVGREKVVTALTERPELLENVRQAIFAKTGAGDGD